MAERLLRPLMAEAIEGLTRGEAPIVVAPTGYGKTVAAPVVHEVMTSGGLASGLIHVSPLRALLDQVHGLLKEKLGKAGRQELGYMGPDKASYLLLKPVATTMDSFLSNLYRLPTSEYIKILRGASLGHYYPALAAIDSSVVVLDEAHLALDGEATSGVGMNAFLAALTGLAGKRVPLMITTASLPKPALDAAAERLRRGGVKPVVYRLRCPNAAPRGGGSVADVNEVDDREYFDNVGGLRWSTVLSDWGNALRYAAEEGEKGPVLVVANTVARAFDAYRTLVEKHGLPKDRVVLIHGRMTHDDKKAAMARIKRLSMGEPGVVVATQVVEAGVDVNALMVVSEAAPATSLVQRAGRACRKGKVLDLCLEEGAKFVVVAEDYNKGPYNEDEIDEALKALKAALKHGDGGIDWRNPCPGSPVKSYEQILEEAYHKSIIRETALERLFNDTIINDASPQAVLDLLDSTTGACGVYRSLAPASLYVEGKGLIPVSLESLSRGWAKEVVETIAGKPVVVALKAEHKGAWGVRVVEVKRWPSEAAKTLLEENAKCKKIVSSLYEEASRELKNSMEPVNLALLVKDGIYHEGLGIVGA